MTIFEKKKISNYLRKLHKIPEDYEYQIASFDKSKFSEKLEGRIIRLLSGHKIKAKAYTNGNRVAIVVWTENTANEAIKLCLERANLHAWTHGYLLNSGKLIYIKKDNDSIKWCFADNQYSVFETKSILYRLVVCFKIENEIVRVRCLFRVGWDLLKL